MNQLKVGFTLHVLLEEDWEMGTAVFWRKEVADSLTCTKILLVECIPIGTKNLYRCDFIYHFLRK